MENNEGIENKKTHTSSPESKERIADIFERLAQQGHREALLLSGTNKTLYERSRSGTTKKALDQIKLENTKLRNYKFESLKIGDTVRDTKTGNTGTIVDKAEYNWRYSRGPEELTDDYVEVKFYIQIFSQFMPYSNRYSKDGPVDGKAPPYDRNASDITRYDILDLEIQSSSGGKSKRKINKSKKRKTIRSLT